MKVFLGLHLSVVMAAIDDLNRFSVDGEDCLVIGALTQHACSCFYTLRHLLGCKAVVSVIRSRRDRVSYIDKNDEDYRHSWYKPFRRVCQGMDERIRLRSLIHYENYRPAGDAEARDWAYAIPDQITPSRSGVVVNARDASIASRTIAPATGQGKPTTKIRLKKNEKWAEDQRYASPQAPLDPEIAKIFAQVYRR